MAYKEFKHFRANLVAVKSFFTACSWEIYTPTRNLLLNFMTLQAWPTHGRRFKKMGFTMATDQEERRSLRIRGQEYCVAGSSGRVRCNNGYFMEGVTIYHNPLSIKV